MVLRKIDITTLALKGFHLEKWMVGEQIDFSNLRNRKSISSKFRWEIVI